MVIIEYFMMPYGVAKRVFQLKPQSAFTLHEVRWHKVTAKRPGFDRKWWASSRNTVIDICPAFSSFCHHGQSGNLGLAFCKFAQNGAFIFG